MHRYQTNQPKPRTSPPKPLQVQASLHFALQQHGRAYLPDPADPSRPSSIRIVNAQRAVNPFSDRVYNVYLFDEGTSSITYCQMFSTQGVYLQ